MGLLTDFTISLAIFKMSFRILIQIYNLVIMIFGVTIQQLRFKFYKAV